MIGEAGTGLSNGSPGSDEIAFIFDLDGTLVDSVYYHVIAWHTALEQAGIALSVWRIHRRIGMSGGLFINALARELGHRLTATQIETVQEAHGRAYRGLAGGVRPLPGAGDLLRTLTGLGVAWAIATSGRPAAAKATLRLLEIPDGVPVVTRADVSRAKPDPDLLLLGARRLGASIEDCIVVGDSVWDMLAARRARSLGVGLLSGGYGREELEQAGAYRVYADPLDLLRHLDEVGVRLPEARS